MKLENSSITFLVSGDKTTIELRDNDAATTFCKVTLTPEELSKALSRLSNTPCNIEVHNVDRLGKMHENETFEFEIPKELRGSSNTAELTKMCINSLKELSMEEWKTDGYFASQNTFFERDGKTYARCTIRRWI